MGATIDVGRKDILIILFRQFQNELGGLAELEQRNGTFYIQGYSCLLAAVVPSHPEVCRLSETLISELVGLQMKECCDGNEPARRCFSVPKR